MHAAAGRCSRGGVPNAALTRPRTSRIPAAATTTATSDLQGDGVGSHEGDDGGGEAADGDEQGVEREVVQLHGDQHHADCDPCNGQSGPFVVPTILRSDNRPGVQSGSAPHPPGIARPLRGRDAVDERTARRAAAVGRATACDRRPPGRRSAPHVGLSGGVGRRQRLVPSRVGRGDHGAARRGRARGTRDRSRVPAVGVGGVGREAARAEGGRRAGGRSSARRAVRRARRRRSAAAHRRRSAPSASSTTGLSDCG